MTIVVIGIVWELSQLKVIPNPSSATIIKDDSLMVVGQLVCGVASDSNIEAC